MATVETKIQAPAAARARGGKKTTSPAAAAADVSRPAAAAAADADEVREVIEYFRPEDTEAWEELDIRNLAVRAKRGECATSANNGYYFEDPLLKRAREEVRAVVKPERDALVNAVLAAGGQNPTGATPEPASAGCEGCDLG